MSKLIVAALDGDVGAKILRFILSKNYPVLALFTTSDRCINIAGNSIKKFSKHEDLELFLNGYEKFENELFLVHAWTKTIFQKSLLQLFDKTLNIHPGVVPDVRGSFTATWAVRNRLPIGVSLLEISEEIDAGKVYSIDYIDDYCIDSGDNIQKKLKKRCIDFFEEKFEDIYSGKINSKAQSGAVNTFTKKMTHSDRILEVNLQMSVEDFLRWGLSHNFPGKTYPIIKLDKRFFRVDIREVEHGSDFDS